MRGFIAVLLCYVLLLTFALGGCKASNGAVRGISKYEIYNPPITLTTFSFKGPQVKYMKGEDADNNVWTRAYEEYLGIKLESINMDNYLYDTRVSSAIASNKIPDILPIYTSLFYRFLEADLLYDLTNVYEKYASESIKNDMEVRANGLAMNVCTRDGKLYALAQPPSDSPDMLLIRQDWLDKYQLNWPENIYETIDVAKTFVDKNEKKTVAFPINEEAISGFANAFGAYHKIWVEDAKGQLVRGETLPVWKPVLKELANLYAEGYINRNFEIDNFSTNTDNYGLAFFNGAFGHDLINYVRKNPEAKWKHNFIKDSNGHPAKVQMDTRVSYFYGASKDIKYPEALINIANLNYEIQNNTDENFNQFYSFESDGEIYDSFFYADFIMGSPKEKRWSMIEINNALDSQNQDKLTVWEKGFLNKMQPWLDHPDTKAGVKGFDVWMMYGSEGTMFTQKRIIDNEYYYASPAWGRETLAWIDKGPELEFEWDKRIVRFVKSEVSIEEGFDDWVRYFNKHGGTKATEEINAWWEAEGKAGMEGFKFD